jgi:hypothetical protein
MGRYRRNRQSCKWHRHREPSDIGLLVVIGMLMRDGRNRHAGAVALWLAGLAMTTWGLGVLALAGSFVAIDARRRRDVVVA